MIYYITKVNMVTGDEIVMTSHDSLERAVDAHTSFTVANTDENTTFRIDTVLSNEEVRAANARIKLDANRRFGRAKMDHEEGYPEKVSLLDSLRANEAANKASETVMFTMTELFGWYDGEQAADRLINCRECGAVVSYDNKQMSIHQAWHNKLLP